MDVNEEIVQMYFEQKGYMVLPNLKYEIRHSDNSMGWGDIDLAIYNPVNNDRAVVQVKGWHTTPISKSYVEKEINKKRILKMLEKDAIECATKFFQSSYFKKILVIGYLPKSEDLQKETLEYLKSLGFDEILIFKEVLGFLIKGAKENIYYKESMVMFLISKLKLYGFFKDKDL